MWCALSNGHVANDLGCPPNPQTTPISAFFVAFHIFVAGEHRDFKFGTHVGLCRACCLVISHTWRAMWYWRFCVRQRRAVRLRQVSWLFVQRRARRGRRLWTTQQVCACDDARRAHKISSSLRQSTRRFVCGERMVAASLHRKSIRMSTVDGRNSEAPWIYGYFFTVFTVQPAGRAGGVEGSFDVQCSTATATVTTANSVFNSRSFLSTTRSLVHVCPADCSSVCNTRLGTR